MPPVVELTEAPAADHKAVLLFYASWHDATAAMTQVLEALAASSTGDESIVFAKVQAEENPLLSKKYEVKAVPTFILLQKDGSIATRIEGVNQVSTLTQAVQRLTQSTAETDVPENMTTIDEQLLTARLDGLIRSAPVMVFMKGSPTAPRCGFSRQVVELLQEEEIPFGSFDIMVDNDVRQGLKKHSDWPTYPQLYVHGELVGGLDILKEMKEDATLKEGLELTDTDLVAAASTSLEDRLKALTNQSPIMLFMKGLPSAPQCGFSRQTVAILEQEGVSFGAFDILTDDEVRQGLKTYSDWPTYPQLYVNGELLGGLDIIQEMESIGSLKEALAGNA
jgi:Grx4 family monothiol glutaredoxin